MRAAPSATEWNVGHPHPRAAAARTGWAALLPAVLTGLLTGGMIFIDAVLVPFWRGLPPPDFRRWFRAHAARIRAVMIPLGVGAGVVNVAATIALTSGGRGRSGAPASAVATAATAGVIAITLAVNEPANHRFAGGALSDSETRNLLRTWTRWHHARVVLGLVATLAATAALGNGRGSGTSVHEPRRDRA